MINRNHDQHNHKSTAYLRVLYVLSCPDSVWWGTRAWRIWYNKQRCYWAATSMFRIFFFNLESCYSASISSSTLACTLFYADQIASCFYSWKGSVTQIKEAPFLFHRRAVQPHQRQTTAEAEEMWARRSPNVVLLQLQMI